MGNIKISIRVDGQYAVPKPVLYDGSSLNLASIGNLVNALSCPLDEAALHNASLMSVSPSLFEDMYVNWPQFMTVQKSEFNNPPAGLSFLKFNVCAKPAVFSPVMSEHVPFSVKSHVVSIFGFTIITIPCLHPSYPELTIKLPSLFAGEVNNSVATPIPVKSSPNGRQLPPLTADRTMMCQSAEVLVESIGGSLKAQTSITNSYGIMSRLRRFNNKFSDLSANGSISQTMLNNNVINSTPAIGWSSMPSTVVEISLLNTIVSEMFSSYGGTTSPDINVYATKLVEMDIAGLEPLPSPSDATQDTYLVLAPSRVSAMTAHQTVNDKYDLSCSSYGYDPNLKACLIPLSQLLRTDSSPYLLIATAPTISFLADSVWSSHVVNDSYVFISGKRV